MVNIIPLNDSKEHIEDTTCGCDPTVDTSLSELLITHNSYDGREGLEEALDVLGKDVVNCGGWVVKR